MKNIVSVHFFITRINIGCDISLGMADMKPFAGWIRKHIKHIIFRLPRKILRLVKPFFFPIFLPLGLYFIWIIFVHFILLFS